MISFRIDRVDLLAVHEVLKSLPQHYSLKVCSSVLSLLYVQLSRPYILTRKTIALTIRTFLGTALSNTMARFVTVFPPRRRVF